MKLYFAGYRTMPKIFANIPEAQNLLSSYWEQKTTDFKEFHKKHNLSDRKFFLDSGAFTAYTLGKKIDLKAYCDYIKEYQDMIEVYANLDVIKDWKATRINNDYMKSQGLKPLTTFHIGSPLEELERICQEEDYFALGGVAALTGQKDITRFFDSCFSVIKNHWPKKIHAFGVTSFELLKRYPFYSSDSTSWLMGGKFRRITQLKGMKIKTTGKKSDEISKERYRVHMGHYKELNSHNIRSLIDIEKFITDLWTERGITWK